MCRALLVGSIANRRVGDDDIVPRLLCRRQWQRLASEGVTEKELTDAKTYLTGAYPLRFDGNGRIASILVGMQMDDLPIDYVQTRNDKVNAVTLEEINRVAGEILMPEALHFVVVGRPEGLIASP